MFVSVQLVLGGVFCGNQSNCRICILIRECCNGLDSLELCRIAWKGWKVMNDWNVRNVSGTTGMSGKTGKTGMSGMSGKTGMSGISVVTGVPLEGLAAGMPGMSL